MTLSLGHHGHKLMTMSTKQTIAAGRFKARCLALLDRVARTGEEVVITKRGKPVAKVVPITAADQPSLVGSVRTREDIVGPILETWDLER
jgi:prevent-host-death family protein